MRALHSTDRDRRIASRSPSVPYALVVGTYVTLLLAPAVAGLIVAAIDGDTAVTAGTGLAAVVGLLVGVTWLVGRVRGFPERVGGSWLAYAFEVGAICALVGYVVVAGSGSIPDTLAFLGALTSSGGLVVGLFLTRMSRTRHAAAVVRASTISAEWTAGWPVPRTRKLRNASVVGIVVGTPLILAGLFTSLDWSFPAGHLVLWAGILGGGLGQERTYRVTPAGLERSRTFRRVLYDWKRFTGYRDAGDALVIERRDPWRPSFRCAWAQIEDPAAVRVALSEHLERDP